MDIHTILSRNIRRLASKRKWSQNLLADFSGISRSNLSTVLRGQKSPTVRTLEKIAAALEVEVWELFVDEKK